AEAVAIWVGAGCDKSLIGQLSGAKTGVLPLGKSQGLGRTAHHKDAKQAD
ncbi:MAG: hypothetical protein RL368_1601, partial [Pseudomonadota bacterium]